MILTKGCPECGGINKITINGETQCWNCYIRTKNSVPSNPNTKGKTAQKKAKEAQ